MKLLKSFILIFIVFILLITTGLLSLPYLIKADTIKYYLNQQITLATQQKTEIKGALNWQLFPTIGIKVNNIEIGNPGASHDTHARIKELVLKAKFLPLLHKQFVVNEINIDGLNAVLDLDTAKKAKATESEKPSVGVSKKTNPPVIQVRKFRVTDSQIVVYRGQQPIRISNLQIKTKNFNLNRQPFSLQINASFNTRDKKLQSSGQFGFKGNAEIIQSSKASLPLQLNGQIDLQNLKLNKFLINQLSGDIRIKEDRIDINPLNARLYQGQSKGMLSLSPQGILSLQQTAAGLNGEKLFSNITGEKLIGGTLGFSINSMLPLKDPSLLEALNATGEFTLTSGTLFDIDIKAIISTFEQQIKEIWRDKALSWRDALGLSKVDPRIATQGNTPFEKASASFSIARGQFNTRNIEVLMQHLKVSGQIDIDLMSENLQGNLQTRVTELPAKSHLNRIQRKLGGQFPLTVSGTLSKPLVLPDQKIITPIIKNYILKDTIRTKLEKPVKKIGHELKKLFH